MTGRAEQVFSNTLTLPINERAELAERLFSSLDISKDKIDKLWAKFMNVVFLEAAEFEFNEAIMFYNIQREDLIYEFASEEKMQ